MSKTSYRGSNNSFEDDSNSSDADISSHDDEFDRLNRIRTMDDEDYDYKIKWFFDRIERQAAQNVEKPLAPKKDDFENLDSTNTNNTTSPQESSFSSNPIESDSHSTNEESSSHEDNAIIGKRRLSESDSYSIQIRQKLEEESKENNESGTLLTCIFPQFK